MKRIDVHVHFLAKKYLDEFLTVSPHYSWGKDPVGTDVLLMNGGTVMQVLDTMWDPEPRLREMAARCPDIVQAVCTSTPHVYLEDEEATVRLSRVDNDEIDKLRKTYPDHFYGFGVVPLPHTARAVEEMERVLLEKKMNGVVLGTNVLGRYLDDPSFLPFFKRADELGACIFLHPQPGAGMEQMADYGRIVPILSFVFDTTLAVLRMTLSGLFDKCPNIKFILPHLGGALPYLFGRVDSGYEMYPEFRLNIKVPPSEILKHMYYDIITYNSRTIQYAADLIGADHLLFGSDYPHTIGKVENVIAALDGAGFTEAELRKINYENAQKVLNNITG